MPAGLPTRTKRLRTCRAVPRVVAREISRPAKVGALGRGARPRVISTHNFWRQLSGQLTAFAEVIVNCAWLYRAWPRCARRPCGCCRRVQSNRSLGHGSLHDPRQL